MEDNFNIAASNERPFSWIIAGNRCFAPRDSLLKEVIPVHTMNPYACAQSVVQPACLFCVSLPAVKYALSEAARKDRTHLILFSVTAMDKKCS